MYSIRCTNPKTRGKAKAFEILSDIDGEDIYCLMQDYISSKTDKLYLIEKDKKVFGFFDVKYEPTKRCIYGWMHVGHYGVKSDIIDIETGKVDFKMSQKNAGLIEHYFRFFVPLKFNEGIALFHSCRRSGIKSLFCGEFMDYVSSKNGFRIQMNPLSYNKAFDKWTDANTKEIRLISFSGLNDITDQINKLGHDEQQQDLVIKAKINKKNSSLGRFIDYITEGSEQLKVIEVLSQHCSHIKTVVQIGSKRRTFSLGGGHPVCEIDIDEDILTHDGSHDIRLIDGLCSELVGEIAKCMYPNVGVET
ncbi:MAG: hypothetical protein PHF37_06415 [Phycisphaerae bacterium]|nr:hypothetical protein [Phycisphaerae bacterium]